MDKVAVDKATKDYWDNYFSEYGKMWTRDIPRRIKSAMVHSEKITASKVDGIVLPMAYKIGDEDSLSIEAAFRGEIDGNKADILITADFDAEGKMKDLDINPISMK